MPLIDVELLEGRAGADPALELAASVALLDAVASGERGPLLRVYRPPPTVAFGRRDRSMPGFRQAAAAARRHGFTPVIRLAGGRAAAYADGCLVLDEIMPAAEGMAEMHERFADRAELHALALRALGVDARVGQVPGEYCPGEFSVNARGEVKLAGSAQRIIRGAWLFATVIVVEFAAPIEAVVNDVYAALGLTFDPATTGSVAGESSATTVRDVQEALVAQYARRYRLVPAALTAQDLTAAQAISERHRVSQEPPARPTSA
jgi:octanoyl-[GcvH]:protein N-octanoyltransferase